MRIDATDLNFILYADTCLDIYVRMSAFRSDKASIRNTYSRIHHANYNQRSYPVNEGFFFCRATRNKNAKRNMVIHWFAADESGGVS